MSSKDNDTSMYVPNIWTRLCYSRYTAWRAPALQLKTPRALKHRLRRTPKLSANGADKTFTMTTACWLADLSGLRGRLTEERTLFPPCCPHTTVNPNEETLGWTVNSRATWKALDRGAGEHSPCQRPGA